MIGWTNGEKNTYFFTLETHETLLITEVGDLYNMSTLHVLVYYPNSSSFIPTVQAWTSFVCLCKYRLKKTLNGCWPIGSKKWEGREYIVRFFFPIVMIMIRYNPNINLYKLKQQVRLCSLSFPLWPTTLHNMAFPYCFWVKSI